MGAGLPQPCDVFVHRGGPANERKRAKTFSGKRYAGSACVRGRAVSRIAAVGGECACGHLCPLFFDLHIGMPQLQRRRREISQGEQVGL